MHKESLLADTIFLVHDFLSVEECRFHIERSETSGYTEATIGGANGEVFKEIRDNARAMLDDLELAAAMYVRVAEFLPADWFGWTPVGLNERWRYYRYDPGQRFAPHTDGCISRENGEQSHFTLLVYLNDDYQGGCTNFYLSPGRKKLVVRPQAGTALLFAHKMVHEGAAVEQGRKYALRTDVMFRSGERPSGDETR